MEAASAVAASAEFAGDDEGGWLGPRVSIARDIAERLALGAELAWAPRAASTWTELDVPSFRERTKGRALAFFALHTPPAQAEGALAVGFGLDGESRKERDPADGSMQWRALEPSLVAVVRF